MLVLPDETRVWSGEQSPSEINNPREVRLFRVAVPKEYSMQMLAIRPRTGPTYQTHTG